jgi:hypothetical protein
MNRRPIILPCFSVFLVGVAFSFPIQIMFLYGHSPLEIGAILSKMTELNWAVFVLLNFNAYLIQRGSPLAKFFIPVGVILVAVNNWYVGMYGQDYPMSVTVWGSVGFALSHLVLLHKQAMEIFENPRARWWLRPPRVKVDLPANISPYMGASFKARTYDLSVTGAFLAVESFEALGEKPLQPNDLLTLNIRLGHMSQIRCDARVVRRADSARGIYPPGVGLSFIGLSRENQRRIQRHLETMM